MKKILLYIEPHPIRNSFLMFRAALLSYARMFSEENKDCIRVYSSYENLDKTLEWAQQRHLQPFTICNELESYFIYPDKEDDDFFVAQLQDWDNGGIAVWRELMTGRGISERYEDIICRVHEKYDFDYIVYWGTNAAVRKAAARLGVGCVDMELGCSRRPYMDTVVMDPWGVNGSSSISQARIEDFDCVPPSDAYADLLLNSYRHSSSGYESDFAPPNCHELLRLMGQEKIAFIPLQLYDDANLLEYAPFEEVIEVLQSVLPRLKEAGYYCIIKEHPLSARRFGSEAANAKAYEYAKQFDNIFWMGPEYKDIPNAFLYRLAELIVTVNSATGFEALYYNKPVVVLGEAVYKVAGAFPTLDEYLSKQFNAAEYVEKTSRIRNFFLNYYLIPSEIFENWPEFYARVCFVGELSKQKLTTGEIVAQFVKKPWLT